MEKTISAAEANRSFSRLLRDVRAGHSYVVTSHGMPVARLSPVTSDRGRAAAKQALLERLSKQPAVHIERWTRDELYEDDP
jgi:prevent-host-death family protein